MDTLRILLLIVAVVVAVRAASLLDRGVVVEVIASELLHETDDFDTRHSRSRLSRSSSGGSESEVADSNHGGLPPNPSTSGSTDDHSAGDDSASESNTAEGEESQSDDDHADGASTSQENGNADGNGVTFAGPGAASTPTAQPSTVSSTVAAITTCAPRQQCADEDVLDTGDASFTPSMAYAAVFRIFSADLFDRSVEILLSEANDQSTAMCAQDFNQLNDTVLRVTQADGQAYVDYIFPQPQIAGRALTLDDAEVRISLPDLGLFGTLQLRLSYDSSGGLQSSQQFIQPPGQADPDMFYPFPILRVVCVEDPTACAADSPLPAPVPVAIPNPLPAPTEDELATVAIPAAFSAQCLG